MQPVRFGNQHYSTYVPLKDRTNLVSRAIKLVQRGVEDANEVARKLNVNVHDAKELISIAQQDRENKIDAL